MQAPSHIPMERRLSGDLRAHRQRGVECSDTTGAGDNADDGEDKDEDEDDDLMGDTVVDMPVFDTEELYSDDTVIDSSVADPDEDEMEARGCR